MRTGQACTDNGKHRTGHRDVCANHVLDTAIARNATIALDGD
jgi:hypothetical protein